MSVEDQAAVNELFLKHFIFETILQTARNGGVQLDQYHTPVSFLTKLT